MVTLVSFVPGLSVPSAAGQRLSEAIQLAAQALIGAESHLTELDRIVGDDDMGISLARPGNGTSKHG